MNLNLEQILDADGFELTDLVMTHLFGCERDDANMCWVGPTGEAVSLDYGNDEWVRIGSVVEAMRTKGWMFDLRSYETGDGLGEWYAGFHNMRLARPQEAAPSSMIRGPGSVGTLVCQAALMALLDAETQDSTD